MPLINERLFLPADDNITELKRQLQFAWQPMVQMVNSFMTLYVQATLPTIPLNTTALWVNITIPATPTYFLVSNFGGTHKSVELT